MALLEDVRFGLRTMAKNPTSTLVAVVALSLGLGANAVVFSIAYGVLFKNMPFVSDRILYLHGRDAARAGALMGVSLPDFRDWSAQAKSFRGLGAFTFGAGNISDQGGVPQRYNLAQITTNAFSLIGQKPVLGRDCTEEDAKPGAARVAVLSHSVWQNRYGGANSILGRTIRVNGVPTTVIGVMRPDFRFPIDADLWMPLTSTAELEKRESRGLNVFGDLTGSATQASATAEMDGIAHNLERAYPESNRGITAAVRNFSEENNDPDDYTTIATLMGSVIFVLLIACANVANLLLARSVDRSREVSIRVALGAGRWRIIRQLLVESVMLSSVAGLLGWLIAIVGLRVIEASVRSQIPAWMTFSMDYRALAYLAAISLGTGMLFGLAPALRLAGLNVNLSLREGGRGSSGSRRGRHLSGALVVLEMALAMVLLTGAGLMIRTILNMRSVNPGVNVKNVLVMRLFLPDAKYPHPADQISFHERLKARLEAVPGVEASTIALTMPTGGSLNFPYELEHAAPVEERLRPKLNAEVITPDYFRVMDVRITRGRAFNESDGVSGPPAIIVNQRLAEKFWPGEDALGKRLRIFNDNKPEPWLTVVGVAPNILQNDIAVRQFDPLIYIPYRQRPFADMALMARTRVPPETLINAFRRETQSADPDLPLYNVRTLEERLANNYWEQRIFTTLLSIFAGVALLLASLGLYAVIAHSVNQRTQEIGVRMALGASEGNILRAVFRQGMLQLAIGLALGIGAALGLTRFLNSMLVLVTATDPITFAMVALVLGAAAVLGCLIPARRATRVDPLIALRYE